MSATQSMLMESVGIVAGMCTTFSFLPQALKALKTKDTKSLSLSMYSIFVSGVFLWIVYGLMIESFSVVAANVITFLLAGMVLFLKIRHG
ncbi:SemiSWEET transporter [Desulfovibrio inopinatus]|uniref:SemiSWEET transporter n=1 Tax=Desulfovibrio inopinatus TaxID=102109 RepID=UPI001B7F86E8|nr:SemiSWEET transporter [Desulfovibrio inopinatus]